MTPRPWFRSFGWTYRPIAWPGYLITTLAGVFVAQALVAIDRQSHSASDTLFGIVPYALPVFLLLNWIASKRCA